MEFWTWYYLVKGDEIINPVERPGFFMNNINKICGLNYQNAFKPCVILTNGCFDIFHAGHAQYLEIAKSYGDYLIVGLNGDASVKTLKGDKRPINKAMDRAIVLASLSCVDKVIIFEEVNAVKLIESVKPDIYIKGGDYNKNTLNQEEKLALEQIGARVVIVKQFGNLSTSNIIKNII